MSSSFRIKEHFVDAQHIREYARATSLSQEETLKLVVKQYTPLNNLQPQPGDITIIGGHANGFPKELYEPLWEDLLAQAAIHGFKIRNIWIADVAWQGASEILNADLLGNDPSWFDHSRDLLHMINHFRTEMPMPIVGIGHSLGGAVLTNLSLMHPRLFSTLILLDPVIQEHNPLPNDPSPAAKSAFRKDTWPSRADAEASFRSKPFYQAWDSRVLDKWCQYGLTESREQPAGDGKTVVKLTTSKHQECFTFLRQGWDAFSSDGKDLIHPRLVPDITPIGLDLNGFYRAEPSSILLRLSALRPSTLYIFGDTSSMSTPVLRKAKMDITGTGVGGSGGQKLGRVKEVVLDGVGHLVAMEAPKDCAHAAASWIGKEMARLEQERREYLQWTQRPLAEKQMLSEEWKQRARGQHKSKM